VPTPNELRQLAAEIEARAKAKALELRRLADEMESALEGLPIVTDGHTMATMNTDTTAPSTPPSSRPGVKLTPESGPYGIAALNAGITLRKLGERIGVGYSAIKMRNAKKLGDKAIRKLLAKPPYSVPASAWPSDE
jgi:hypothetical protein